MYQIVVGDQHIIKRDSICTSENILIQKIIYLLANGAKRVVFLFQFLLDRMLGDHVTFDALARISREFNLVIDLSHV